ncbi:MAG: mechanosensitive ion channel family protein [Planctomycetota bacterium]|nr:mechanosensitive ion channel family protein [Planctomycetota bacterium]
MDQRTGAGQGVGGLAVALAMQDTLANFFSGIVITITRSIRTGDYVNLDSGEEGYVTDITWRNAVIRTVPNNLVIVPNTTIATSSFTNYHLDNKESGIKLEVGVAYDSDLKKVEKATLEVANATLKELQGGVTSFEPKLRYHTFDSSSINFSLIFRVEDYFDRFMIVHELIKRIHERYEQENIEIPFPITNIYYRTPLELQGEVAQKS